MAGAPIDALRSVSLFADLDDSELSQVALLFKQRRFSAGDTVVMEGADGAAFFLIESGEATVSVRGTERAGLGPGDHFGEIALLRDVPRTATVRAKTDVELYALERDDFIAAVTGHAGSAQAAEAVVGARLGVSAV
jgi:CRP-like cAMP-binding protein